MVIYIFFCSYLFINKRIFPYYGSLGLYAFFYNVYKYYSNDIIVH